MRAMKSVFLAEEVVVRDVMSSPVIELDAEETAHRAAQLMAKYGISSVVITSGGKAVGIVTKRDLVVKVLAEDKRPSEVKLGSIMSSPLYTVSPEESIEDAVRRMNNRGVSRLVVTYKDTVQGIISLKDVLKVTPEIIEILKEQVRLRGSASPRSEPYIEGYCDSCAEWSDMLQRVDEQYLCEECRLELEEKRE